MQHLFIIKTLSQLEKEGNLFDLIKEIYQKTTVKSYLLTNLESFPLRPRMRHQFNTVL